MISPQNNLLSPVVRAVNQQSVFVLNGKSSQDNIVMWQNSGQSYLLALLQIRENIKNNTDLSVLLFSFYC